MIYRNDAFALPLERTGGIRFGFVAQTEKMLAIAFLIFKFYNNYKVFGLKSKIANRVF